MVQSSIFKNCKNEYWRSGLQVSLPPLPEHHKMSKIFNKNTIKLTYGCCGICAQSLLPTIEELFNELLIIMDATAETEPYVHLIKMFNGKHCT